MDPKYSLQSQIEQTPPNQFNPSHTPSPVWIFNHGILCHSHHTAHAVNELACIRQTAPKIQLNSTRTTPLMRSAPDNGWWRKAHCIFDTLQCCQKKRTSQGTSTSSIFLCRLFLFKIVESFYAAWEWVSLAQYLELAFVWFGGCLEKALFLIRDGREIDVEWKKLFLSSVLLPGCCCFVNLGIVWCLYQIGRFFLFLLTIHLWIQLKLYRKAGYLFYNRYGSYLSMT